MGWNRGLYYTRSHKVNGRVIREYVGGGRVGELAARLDALKRQEREAQRAAFRAAKAEADALDASLNELHELADFLTRAVLLAAGFHQHKRGEWRKRRAHKAEHQS